ncbi:MAG: hypothetical protein MZU79_05800 [Anaerotruncus sp.]|nr:hypothetical protein [Anaerotruncus sp.]
MDHLRQRDVHVMVSTHYPELKIYAFDKDDVQNASVEFDIQTLRPTYRLLQGIPGTSNAIDIASRLGLSSEIIEHAKRVSLTFDNQTMNLIRKLERQIARAAGGDRSRRRRESAKLKAKQAALEAGAGREQDRAEQGDGRDRGTEAPRRRTGLVGDRARPPT